MIDKQRSRKLARLLVATLFLALPGFAVAAHPEKHKPGEVSTPAQAAISPADALMIRWEEEAMRRGKFVCLNPAHHHQLSPQMHMLIDEDLNR